MIPIRPLARVLTHVLWIAGGSVVRATYKAYKEAVRNNNVSMESYFRRQMSKEEAAKILGFASHEGVTVQQIEEAHQRLRNINTPSSNFAGSPYLLEKIDAAQHVLRSKQP